MDTQLVEGLPRPPHWYVQLEGVTDDCEDIWQKFPPPPLPTGTVSVFGAPHVMDEVIKRVPLDSDTKLFVDSGDNAPDLKTEFARLFEDMLNEIGYLMGQCSQLGVPGVGNVGSTAKKVIKLYKNLHHILAWLRNFQFYETILKRLQTQHAHRLQLINDVRQIAFKMQPLTQAEVLPPR